MENQKYYYKIDVISRKHGYSFMISNNTEIENENDVIDIALENNLFECEYDAERAVIDNLVSNMDVEHFTRCGCVYEV